MWFGGNWVALSSGPIAKVASEPSSIRSVNALTWVNPWVSRWMGTPTIGDTSVAGEPPGGTSDGDAPGAPLVPLSPHAASATTISTTRPTTTGSRAASLGD